jgi:hypothetical protein
VGRDERLKLIETTRFNKVAAMYKMIFQFLNEKFRLDMQGVESKPVKCIDALVDSPGRIGWL